MLQQALTELRMNYVDEVKKAAAAAAPPQADAPSRRREDPHDDRSAGTPPMNPS